MEQGAKVKRLIGRKSSHSHLPRVQGNASFFWTLTWDCQTFEQLTLHSQSTRACASTPIEHKGFEGQSQVSQNRANVGHVAMTRAHSMSQCAGQPGVQPWPLIHPPLSSAIAATIGNLSSGSPKT